MLEEMILDKIENDDVVVGIDADIGCYAKGFPDDCLGIQLSAVEIDKTLLVDDHLDAAILENLIVVFEVVNEFQHVGQARAARSANA